MRHVVIAPGEGVRHVWNAHDRVDLAVLHDDQKDVREDGDRSGRMDRAGEQQREQDRKE
jgi:hypothetical protein